MIIIIRFILDKDITSAFVYLLSSIFVIFLVLPFHEFAHAWSAKKLGDTTAKYQGRLTLNPLAHIDWIGAAMIIFVGFGWAKPVPVNPRNFRDPKRDMALTALAGPTSNLIMAFAASFLANLTFFAYVKSGLLLTDNIGSDIVKYVYIFFIFITQINISLAIFNFIPIPPLDGSKILAALLPDRLYYKFMAYERYLYFLLLILLFSSALTAPLTTIVDFIYKAFDYVTALPFGMN